jgi:hypothetical protein
MSIKKIIILYNFKEIIKKMKICDFKSSSNLDHPLKTISIFYLNDCPLLARKIGVQKNKKKKTTT